MKEQLAKHFSPVLVQKRETFFDSLAQKKGSVKKSCSQVKRGLV